jgi:hypothetical protein
MIWLTDSSKNKEQAKSKRIGASGTGPAQIFPAACGRKKIAWPAGPDSQRNRSKPGHMHASDQDPAVQGTSTDQRLETGGVRALATEADRELTVRSTGVEGEDADANGDREDATRCPGRSWASAWMGPSEWSTQTWTTAMDRMAMTSLSLASSWV